MHLRNNVETLPNHNRWQEMKCNNALIPQAVGSEKHCSLVNLIKICETNQRKNAGKTDDKAPAMQNTYTWNFCSDMEILSH